MKKILAFILVLVLTLSLAACSKSTSRRHSKDDDDDDEVISDQDNGALDDGSDIVVPDDTPDDQPDGGNDVQPDTNTLKIGFIFLHDESSTYDNNFMEAARTACGQFEAEMVVRTNVPESTEAYTAALELANEGCKAVFANSYGHESFLMQAARECPDVQFCHAGGVQAHTAGLSNYHNAYAAIDQGRFLTGVVAGLKINQMVDQGMITTKQAKIGFVGTFTYAEVISAYTAFYLGAKSVSPYVTMDVRFTGAHWDESLEKEAAQALIANGCVVISQYSDSMGAPVACEQAGIPNIPYNISTADACPETYLVSARINWVPYFRGMIDSVTGGPALDSDYTGSLWNSSVVLNEFGKNVAPGTADRVAAIQQPLQNGRTHVFDTFSFTVNGQHISSYMADVDYDNQFTPDTQVVESDVFCESSYRSAPYFDLRIDGITLLDEKY